MKIHFLSSSLRTNSGFSIVTKNLALGLQKLGHDVTMSGLQTANFAEFSYGIETLPTITHYVDDLTQFMINVQTIKPDVVMYIHQMDSGQFNAFAKVFKKTVTYVPIETKGVPDQMRNDLLGIVMNGGKVVAQTKYGSEEIQLALGGIDIPYIYHGFDDKIFKTLDLGKIDQIRYCYYGTDDGRTESDPIKLHKQRCYDCSLTGNEILNCPYYKEENVSILRFINGKWTGEDILITGLSGITKGKFVFGFVGYNLGIRKRIERLLRAYSLFIKDSRQLKDRTVLHLHVIPIAIDGLNLIRIVQDLGIQDNVIFSYGSFRSAAWTTEGMNILYNTFDVNISASSGEGFGLSLIESMAAGIPNIGPNSTSFTELIGEDPKTRRGLLASIIDQQMIPDMTMRSLVNESDMSRQMKEMYQNEQLRKQCSKNAIEFTKNYTWNNICGQWDKLLKEMK